MIIFMQSHFYVLIFFFFFFLDNYFGRPGLYATPKNAMKLKNN